jgi:hypothetical protein
MSGASGKSTPIRIDDMRRLLDREEIKEIYEDVIPHWKITEEINATRERMGLGLKPWEYQLKYNNIPEQRRMNFAMKSIQQNTIARLRVSLGYFTLLLIGLILI